MTRAAKQKRSKAEPKRLTPMQRLFALEYIVDLNGTKAAIRAGFSEKTAAQQAYQLLQNPLVRAEIDRETEKKRQRIRMNADQLLDRLYEEADADLADLYDEAGNLKPIHEWPRIWRTGLVAGIETEEVLGASEEDGKPKPVIALRRKIKISDRIKRIELIGRHAGVQAWKERREIGVDQPLKELLREISGQSIRPKG